MSAEGELAAWSGDIAGARASIDEAIRTWQEARRPRAISASLPDLGWGWFNAGDDLRARECIEKSLRLAQSTGERSLVDRARIGLLQMLVAVGDVAQVEPKRSRNASGGRATCVRTTSTITSSPIVR